LERQCQHNRVSNQRFTIYVIIVNREFKFLCRRIREKFLEIHLNGNAHRLEASNALPRCRCRDVRSDKNAVVKAVETNLNRHDTAHRDADNAFAPAFGELLAQGQHSLFADAM